VAGSTYYDLFGLPSTATPAEIKAAYRRLIPRVHPDSGGTDALFHQVQEAYETLSDPAKRATYDRCMKDAPQGARAGCRAEWGGADERHPPPRASSSRHPQREAASAAKSRTGTQPGGLWTTMIVVIAAFIVIVLVLGAVLGRLAGVLIAVGLLAMSIAFVQVLGSRRVRQREAYRLAGMAAVDTMTGTQFKCLLGLLFSEKGYLVARVGGRGESGADLLLGSPGSRTIVEVKRRTDVVRHGAVQQVVAAKAYYGANQAVVVASSNFSDRAIALARSNNVTLWDRALVSQELMVLRNMRMLSPTERFGSELRAGVPPLAGGLLAAFVTLTASSSGKKRRRRSTIRHRRSRRRHH
jgi:restriction system protein